MDGQRWGPPPERRKGPAAATSGPFENTSDGGACENTDPAPYVKPVSGPSIALARLYEKTSRRGQQYFTGRLGLAKLVLLRSDEIADDGTPIWLLQVQEPSIRTPSKAVLVERAEAAFHAPTRPVRPDDDGPALAADHVDDYADDRGAP